MPRCLSPKDNDYKWLQTSNMMARNRVSGLPSVTIVCLDLRNLQYQANFKVAHN